MGILGIDVGTTGCKATLFGDSGIITATSYREYKTLHLGDGRYEIDPNVVWENVKEVVLDCTIHSREVIRGISVSSFGEAAVYLDEEDNVIRNSMLYTDSRGDLEVIEIEDKIGTNYIKDSTGLSLHKMYTLPKLLWIRNNELDNYKRIRSILLFGDFITYRLSGKRFIDPALASRSMICNISDKEWDKRILQDLDLDKSMFSIIKPIGFCIGKINEEISTLLNLDKDCEVYVGSHDQVCASIGSMAVEVDSAMLGLGTVSCMTPVFRPEKICLENLLNYPIVPFTDSLSMTYVVNFTSGSLLRWFRDEIAHHETIRAMENSENVYTLLGENMPSDPTNLFVLPHFAGSGTPIMDPLSKGVMYGLGLETTRYSIYKALMEGVAYELKYNLDYIEKSGISINCFYGTGGGTNSKDWCQIISDITEKPLHVLNQKESGNIGLYGIVSVAMGRFATYDQAIKEVNSIDYTVLPSVNSQIYKKNYLDYVKLYKLSIKMKEV